MIHAYRLPRVLRRVAFLLVALSSLALALPQAADTERKIRLMTEALQARDAGDLELAKSKLEELLKIAPNDASVRRILTSVERMSEAPSAEAGQGREAPEERSASLRREAEYLARLETERIEKAMESAREMREVARRQANRGEYDSALASINRAISALEPNPMTQVLIEELKREEREFLRQRSQYRSAAADGSPESFSLHQASPDFVKLQQQIDVLVLRGRSQFFAGDIEGAEATFKQIEALDPNNELAKNFLIRIARERQSMGYLNKLKTREQLLQEVSNAWQRPSIYEERPGLDAAEDEAKPLNEKLERIRIPSVNFTEVELSKVINTLSAISEQFDATGEGEPGVNLVLLDPDRSDPLVNITLRNLSLKRILDFIVDSVGYQYEVQSDAVVVRPGGERANLDTAFFPVSRSTVIRMTGGRTSSNASRVSRDPYFNDDGSPTNEGGVTDDAQTIQSFLQQAGVDFAGTEGSTLAYDGSGMIVTHSPRNLERIRNILNRYTDVKQVEIEAKFLEIQEGTLEELGFDWIVNANPGAASGEPQEVYRSSLRTLAQSAARSAASSFITIDTVLADGSREVISEPVAPPNLPGNNLLGIGAQPFTNVLGSVDGVNLNVAIRALSQKSGSDLLSAPKVTVLSGNQAEINVSQEFRYPTRYSDTRSDVGSTSGTLTGGSAGVTITPGTPEDFVTRNVGVELAVTPIVEEDDYSITLDLNPRVTEFEGFVEYGGPSIAISGLRVVKTPSGFYQPIFAVREVATKVTIWDGATVVMGGMTREDVVTVKDKVPFLGDVPLFGRFFRSEGESSAKRNLLIFVTANLVSPGGSPKRQSLRGVQPGSLFQNPTLVTPAGSESRSQ